MPDFAKPKLAKFDLSATEISLVGLSNTFDAQVALISSTELQLNGWHVMKAVQPIPQKFEEGEKKSVVSVLDFQGSTSGLWN